MLTPQEIQEKVFTKAVFGGYDMAGVDDFIDELYEDYAALYKDNAILKTKIKILVDKIEEYRSTEDTMRMAIGAAQKASTDMLETSKTQVTNIVSDAEERSAGIIADAQARADEIIADARRQADEKLASVSLAIEQETARLDKARQSVADYVAQVRLLLQTEADTLIDLETVEEPAPVFAPTSGDFIPENNTDEFAWTPDALDDLSDEVVGTEFDEDI